jgi:DNA repair exonuclease SbcCD ATPase subunit
MKISVKNYGGKITRELELPDRGLVLLTGGNGCGKTSLLADAPLYAVTGWTGSRGDPLKNGGEVEFELGELRVKRSRTRAGSSVKVQIWLGGNPVDCDTATKADAYLAERFGPAELWEGLLGFRWDTSSSYSCGTDAERKSATEFLVPTLAGFDAAREKVGARQKAHTNGPLFAARQALALAQQKTQMAQATLDRVRALPDVTDDPEKLRAEIAPLETRRTAIGQRVSVLEQELRSSVPNPTLAAAETRLREAQQTEREARLTLTRAGTGVCPTCRRDLGDKEAALQARAEMNQVLTEAVATLNAVSGEVAALREQAASDQRARQVELGGEIESLRKRWSTADAAIKDLARRMVQAEERQRLGATLSAAQEHFHLAQEELAGVEVELKAQELEQQALDLADRMLGPRGARAGLLARAFSVVEQLAASRLGRVWPGWQLQIARTSETAGGKVREVTRVNGMRPAMGQYPADSEFLPVAAFSRGQLRRIDLPLLLARRQVLAAATENRLALPYLVVDECLDGLDEAGLTGCAELLAEEARRNLVVIIAHDPRIAQGVSFDKIVTLEAT